MSSPRDADTVCAYATLLWDMGKRDHAERSYEMALQLDPGHPEALLSLGTALLERGDYRGAHEKFVIALQRQPHSPQLLLSNALSMEQIEAYTFEEIAEAYRKALNEHSSSHEALFAYGLFLKNKMGRHKETEELYRAALKGAAEDVSLLCSYGVLLTDTGDSDPKRFEA
eukprot:CAMPEP_0206267552 /NCGR_PEP_ID=MMETSP0047_2-20121206/31212_1 /ASSEMBLY_ACC=CAM_ASM_000192 /TAXON_ID=195065 /ORGANISM="Chroomonas mesostigmatica_cf, Strain CCMP1168" /LENGTH=169 /DNA_ID=CAMNT_0053695767 /DNA_START=38 /DNA_END=544 /DNA_ORIENTATION=-